jgi:hypothetical protein
MERTLCSLNNVEFEKLLRAMETHEGWHEGYEEFIEIKKIVGVHINKKKVISEYLIKDMTQKKWYLKDAAVAMAEEGLLYATLVHTKQGTYLRAKHGSKPFKDLIVNHILQNETKALKGPGLLV